MSARATGLVTGLDQDAVPALAAAGERDALPGVDALPGIDLDELVARGARQVRVDRKYVVARAELPALAALLPAGTRVLDIGGRRSFGYRSCYLDTPGLASYLAAGRRRRRRWKVRSRSYLDTGTCWLEVKTRIARGRTLKQRIEHPDLEEAGLSATGDGFVRRALHEAGIDDVAIESLSPVLATGYRRTTLFLPDSASRATVDVDLGWTSLGPGGGRDLERSRLAVVETKTGATPSTIDRLLWARGHRPRQLSKYGVGMAALHPELPDLKWHRVLSRDLGVPPVTPC